MNKLLKNTRIVITRDKTQSVSLGRLIEKCGGKPEYFPVISIKPTDNWSACDDALSEISSFEWLLFSSANSVKYFFQRALSLNIKSPPCKIAAVGEKTAGIIKQRGVHIDLIPDEANAKSLVKSFKNLKISEQKILIPSSNIARNELPDGLKNLGASITTVVVYKTQVNRSLDTEKMFELIKNNQIDCITFFSPSAVKYFIQLLGETTITEIIKNSIVLGVIGETTANALKIYNIPVAFQAETSTEEDLVKSLINHFKNNKRGATINV